MAQIAKVIDLTRSYVPVDPKLYPNNLKITFKEDAPEEMKPLVAYEGYNFLPTSVGYKSYFGVAQSLSVDALTSRCDYILIVQLLTYENKIIALCEDGIWTKIGSESGAWTQEVALTTPAEGEHLEWSYCTIEQTLYCYRATGASYYKLGNTLEYAAQDAAYAASLAEYEQTANVAGLPAGTYTYSVARVNSTTGNLSLPSTSIDVVVSTAGYVTIEFAETASTSYYRVYKTVGGATTYFDVAPGLGSSQYWTDYNIAGTAVTLPDTTVQAVSRNYYEVETVTPNFLNMAGQQGIFKAGIRLGFWDSMNSIAYSSIDDYTDFTPAIETQAGSTIFSDVKGRIVTIKDYGEGFVIYARGSIVFIRQDLESTFQWDPKILVDGVGIQYPRQVAAGLYPEQQFAWTSNGLLKVSQGGKAEFMVTEIHDYLKESSYPVYLRILENRYLFVELMDSSYIEGTVGFTSENVAPITYTFDGYTPTIADLSLNSAVDTARAFQAISLGNTEEQQSLASAAAAAVAAPPKKEGTLYQPKWTAYLSADYLPAPLDITWTNTPCATIDPNGVEKNLCPTGAAGKTSNYTTGSSGKLVSAGIDWTLELFVAVQMAMWKIGDEARAAFLQAVLSRTGSGSLSGLSSTLINSETTTECAIGTYLMPAQYIPEWGMTPCTFYLQRLFDKVMDVERVKVDRIVTTPNEPQYLTVNPPFYYAAINPNVHVNLAARWCSPEERADEIVAALADEGVTGWTTIVLGWQYGTPSLQVWTTGSMIYNYFVNPALAPEPPDGYFLEAYTTDGGATYNARFTRQYPYTTVRSMNAYNNGTQRSEVILDQAFCTVAGWNYTDEDGVARYVERPADGCSDPTKEDWDPWDGAVVGGVAPEEEAVEVTFNSYDPITVPTYPVAPVTWPATSVTVPGGTFLLQTGSIGPIYPTFTGAYVYDLLLQKWGKMKQDYKQLLDFSPLNVLSDRIVSDVEMQTKMGILSIEGVIHLFDSYPADSYIKYGQIGYSRLGMTDAEEVRVNMKEAGDFYIGVEASLDGKNVEAMLSTLETVTNDNKGIIHLSISAKWYNVYIKGHYDLTHLEFRGHITGRR